MDEFNNLFNKFPKACEHICPQAKFDIQRYITVRCQSQLRDSIDAVKT